MGLSNSAPSFDNLFNIVDDFSKLEIRENYEKKNCLIQEIGTDKYYKGFILIDKPLVKTICEIQFFKSNVTGKYIPRPTFRKVDKDNKLKVKEEKKPVIINFSDSEEAESFWRLIGFLNQFKETIDLGEFTQSYKVAHKDEYFTAFKSKAEKEKADDLIELSAHVSEKTLKDVFRSSRKKTIKTFFKLLKNESTEKEIPIEIYRKHYKITDDGEEAIWHHFLKEHDWLLGLNVDIKFIRDFLHLIDLGVQNSKGKGSPIGDILGISDYTTLIELKTASTHIFKSLKNAGDGSRANTWAFTPDFINGVSQCLGQKFEWDAKHFLKDVLDENGKLLNHRENKTIDTKTVFIIGSRNKEFPHDNNPDHILKSETFERFRRNSRNIDVITYDELFERAYHIVFEEKIDKDWWSNPSFKIEV